MQLMRTCAGALLHAAEAAHNNEPQLAIQQAPQDGAAQAPPALGPPPNGPMDTTGYLQQLLQGQQVRLHDPALQQTCAAVFA